MTPEESARLEQLERKLDEVLRFTRALEQLLAGLSSGGGLKALALAAKLKLGG